jgi:plastocyanin
MKLLLASMALLAMMLAGCSGDTSSDCGTQDAEGRYIVCMTSAFKFSPEELTVPVGATVVWRQDSATPHDTEANDGIWKSELLREKGAEFEHSFEEAGSFSYRCNPHEAAYNMVGTITVE